MKLYKIKIAGKVQAVWFRVKTKEEADRLGLHGIVRNKPDGSVYVELEGEPDVLDEFIKWCHVGSEQSEVEEVTVEEGEVHGFNRFTIIG